MLSRNVFRTTIATRPLSASLHTIPSPSFFAGRHLKTTDCLSSSEFRQMLDISHNLKEIYKTNGDTPMPLKGKSMAAIFQKRSTRTRVSSETGMFKLGGHSLFLGPSDIQLGVNESMRDTANVLSRFNDVILARVFGHEIIEELCEHATVPVINALTDKHHPLQTLADCMTLEEHFGRGNLRGKTVAWVGDGNNIIHDLMLGSAKLGMNVRIATPVGYEVAGDVLERTEEIAREEGTEGVFTTTDASVAVKGASVVSTDTWVSMGEEDMYEEKVAEFAGYQVNMELMKKAEDDCVFLHCLPRHEEEVDDEVFYSEKSLVFPEAENRMWTVMAVVLSQLGGKI